jgi:exopolysaccharide/PEP-CTERM locus tyrosine autokinase
MTVNTKPPSRQTGSLVERAAAAFDLGFKKAPLPTNAVVPTVATPASKAQTIAPVPARSAAAPNVQNARTRLRADLDFQRLRDRGFIIPGAPATVLSEEFRLVKRKVLLGALGGPKIEPLPNGRLILVCSGHPNEGKTFTAVNLALSLANETDIEVLLIDADVAKPEVLSTLGLPGDAGLMDALVDQSLDIEQLVIQTDIPKLSVLPAGRAAANDTEALASDYAHTLIQGLIAHNPRRVVVFDSAPVLAASPATVLAHHVGQTLMVVRADQTAESELRESIDLLAGCPHINLMLNSVTYFGSGKKYGAYYGLGD